MQYTVKTAFTFTGEFIVNAESREQAQEFVVKHCGLVLGSDIHTLLPDETIPLWYFPLHPVKTIKKIMKVKKS